MVKTGLKQSCKIKVNAAGDWLIMPPVGQITQVGDAGPTAWGLVDQDDLYVTGKFEVKGSLWQRGSALYVMQNLVMREQAEWEDNFDCGAKQVSIKKTELITIPAGQGAAGFVGAYNLARANAIILGVGVRVTQAPGGGATTFDVGRTGGGNLDEFIAGLTTALNTTGLSTSDGDGVNVGPIYNGPIGKFTVTTDANVIGASLKVRVVVWSRDLIAPTS